MADEKKAFDSWLQREKRLKNTIHRYVSDTARAIEEKRDTADMLIDILYATVISELRDYFEEEYERSYLEGIDGRLESDPDELAVYESVNAEIDGKTFEDRVRDVLYTDDLTDTVRSALDLIAVSDGHRVRADARQAAGEELSSVGYTVTKTWQSMMDEKTRDTHFLLDDTTLPIDGWFETVNGRAKYPGGFGIAEEDCNCRCILSVRATLED